jgi:hypothetical protein
VNTAVAARPLATRERFVEWLRSALDERRGFAAAKLGESERALLQYPLVLQREADPLRVRAFELVLAHKSLPYSGIFPATPEFLREFAAAYAAAVRELDSVGVIRAHWPSDDEFFRHHDLRGEPIDYLDHEPDRSRPSDEARCWLPLLRGRRVLLVCPFAKLLRERATRETFEAVWRNTGKPWFEPAHVDAVEFPYGYGQETQERFGTALGLFADLRTRVEEREFDIALVAAGPLGALLAAALKRRGRVAIALGGHLQVLFGVSGERWRERAEWRRNYFNDAWIEMPARYRPQAGETYADYW